MATKKDECNQGKFTSKLDNKNGYFIRHCKDDRQQRMFAFLVLILNPEKRYSLTFTMATTPLLAFMGKRKVNWCQIMRDLIHQLVLVAKWGTHPTSVRFFPPLLPPQGTNRGRRCTLGG